MCHAIGRLSACRVMGLVRCCMSTLDIRCAADVLLAPSASAIAIMPIQRTRQFLILYLFVRVQSTKSSEHCSDRNLGWPAPCSIVRLLGCIQPAKLITHRMELRVSLR